MASPEWSRYRLNLLRTSSVRLVLLCESMCIENIRHNQRARACLFESLIRPRLLLEQIAPTTATSDSDRNFSGLLGDVCQGCRQPAEATAAAATATVAVCLLFLTMLQCKVICSKLADRNFTCNQRTFFQHDNQHKHNQIRATENAQKQRSKCRRVSHENQQNSANFVTHAFQTGLFFEEL